MRRLVLLLALLAGPAAGEVKSLSQAGFEVEARAVVPATPATAYDSLVRIGGWWNPEHSYSRDAANLSLEPRAGGCFCERLEGGGSVEHMRVVFAWPGRMLRLQGGLGPLQSEGVSGFLTWTLKPVAGGTEIVQTYIVGGYFREGGDKLAPLVDMVLGEQLERLRQKLAAPR